MGLYDGGHRGAGSTAHLASLLGLPVLLVLNAGGMGQSIAALAEGFLHHRPTWAGGLSVRFLGMVCTHVGSARHADLLRQSLAPVTKSAGVPLLGLLPRQGAPELPSRHLGLVEAREALPTVDRQALTQWVEQHCDLNRMCGRPGLRFSAPNQALTGLKTVTAIFRNTFLRWKRAFRPTLPCRPRGYAALHNLQNSKAPLQGPCCFELSNYEYLCYCSLLPHYYFFPAKNNPRCLPIRHTNCLILCSTYVLFF